MYGILADLFHSFWSVQCVCVRERERDHKDHIPSADHETALGVPLLQNKCSNCWRSKVDLKLLVVVGPGRLAIAQRGSIPSAQQWLQIQNMAVTIMSWHLSASELGYI